MISVKTFGATSQKILSLPSLKSLPNSRNYASESVKCKVVLITGSGNATGMAFAETFLKCGAKAVVLVDVGKGEDKETCALIGKYGRDKVVFESCDVTDRAKFDAVFKLTKTTFGHIDYVINNAGFSSMENWPKSICVNNYGMLLGTFYGLHYMGMHKSLGVGGTIINVSSVFGIDPFYPNPVLSGTHHFIRGFTASLGNEEVFCKSKVRIMGLLTGLTQQSLPKTPSQYNFKGLGKLEEEEANMLKNIKPPSASFLGKVLHQILKDGKTGDIWVAEENQVYKIKIIDRKKWKTT